MIFLHTGSILERFRLSVFRTLRLMSLRLSTPDGRTIRCSWSPGGGIETFVNDSAARPQATTSRPPLPPCPGPLSHFYDWTPPRAMCDDDSEPSGTGKRQRRATKKPPAVLRKPARSAQKRPATAWSSEDDDEFEKIEVAPKKAAAMSMKVAPKKRAAMKVAPKRRAAMSMSMKVAPKKALKAAPKKQMKAPKKAMKARNKAAKGEMND